MTRGYDYAVAYGVRQDSRRSSDKPGRGAAWNRIHPSPTAWVVRAAAPAAQDLGREPSLDRLRRTSGLPRGTLSDALSPKRTTHVPLELVSGTREELLAEDVCVAAVLGELAQHVEIHPPQRQRAAPVAVEHRQRPPHINQAAIARCRYTSNIPTHVTTAPR
jgi:hypothetical protein